MPNHTGGPSSRRQAESRWRELVQMLQAETDTIVDEFISRLRQIPPYSRDAVPLELVREDAILSFDYLFRRFAGLPVPPTLAGVATRIGVDRARRQVPLDQLLRAVRLDFRVLWSVLQRLAGPEDMAVLVDHVEQMWAIVEEYTTQVNVAYMNETALIARERHLERSALVARLLDDPRVDEADVERVAIAFGVSPDSSFLVACAPSARQAGLHHAYEAAVAAGRAAHWQDRGTHGLLIAEWRGSDDRAVETILGRVACGIGPIARRLAEVPRSAYVAQRVADMIGPADESPRRVPDVLGALVSSGLGDLRADVADVVLGGLRDATDNERERLLETAQTYLACGSAQDTARQLYCHRNTVLNRLNRFAELTGHDLTVPNEAALVFVALNCRPQTHGVHTRSTAQVP
jgi:hypothetical protein